MKIAKDKKQHALAGFLIGLLIPAPWGIVAWYTAAVFKERLDRFLKERFGLQKTEDISDIYVTVYGGIVGTIFNTLILTLCWK